MFWACQMMTSKGMKRMRSARVTAEWRLRRAAVCGEDSEAASSLTMAFFMRWPAAKARSWVSSGTWSVEARRRRSATSWASKGIGLNGVAEAGVGGEAGGEREGGRRGHAGVGEEVKEGGVVLVDLAEGVFHLAHGLVEDGAEDAVLLVREEGGEGVCDGEGAWLAAVWPLGAGAAGGFDGVGDARLDGAHDGFGLAWLRVDGVQGRCARDAEEERRS